MSAYTDGKAAVLYWSDEFNLTIVSQEENKIVLRGDLKKLTTENMQLQLAVETQGATLAHATGRIESLQADIDRLKAALVNETAQKLFYERSLPGLYPLLSANRKAELLAESVEWNSKRFPDLFKEAGK